MDTLVSTEWLAARMDESDLAIVDASYHLPDTGRDAAAEHAEGHIPGAVFLDLATLVDGASPVDNTLPGPDDFARRLESLGLANNTRIVVYDDSAIRTATRAWYMLTMFGAGDVAILDGGLAKWKSESRPLSQHAAVPESAVFSASSDDTRLRDKEEVLANLDTQHEQVVDARGAGRFTGEEKETRPGLASGHIPGARHVHYAKLYRPDGTLKDKSEIEAIFADAGVDLGKPVVTSCGSGMTACALAFALDRIGKKDVALYDGSWAEWGADPATPKATGSA